MRIITTKRFREFWTLYPDAEKPLRAFAKLVEQAHWRNFAAIRDAYPTTDQVGSLIVFNLGGNKYRLAVRINYQREIIYIRAVMIHRTYDEGRWKED